MARRPEGITDPRKASARRRIGIDDDDDASTAGVGGMVQASFITVNAEPLLTKERHFAPGFGIYAIDHGPNSTFEVGAALETRDEGVVLTSFNHIWDFVGAGVTATYSVDNGRNKTTVTIPGGGGGGGTGVLRSQEFFVNGSWTPPAGVTGAWITMVGGGGGGSNRSTSALGGGGGGAGELAQAVLVAVTPGVPCPIVIGAGGLGSQTSGGAANPGGLTSFTANGLVYQAQGGLQGVINTFTGGAGGGVKGGAGGVTSGAGNVAVAEASLYFGGSGGGGAATAVGNAGGPGAGSGGYAGGAGGASVSSQGGGGGGASTIYGPGGPGGNGGSPGTNGSGFGSGGGGGGGVIGSFSVGGAGAPGYLVVHWVS